MFRSRDLYLRQRTQLINAMHVHLAEYGVLLPSSRASVARMVAMAKERSEDLPAPVFEMVVLMADDIERMTVKVATIDKALKELAQPSPEAKRLRTMPGVGPITAVAIQAFCPAANNLIVAAVLQPGSGWYPGKIRRVAKTVLAGSPKWSSATYAGYL